MKTTRLQLARKPALALCMALAGLGAQATSIRLETATATVAKGSAFDVRVVADIDAADEIIGFGFDWQASSGLGFLSFMAGPGFADDPTYLAPFSDADGIRGASGGSLLFGPAISGANVLLGVLRVQAVDLGLASLGLSADDLGFNFTEGLIPLSANLVNFMPPVSGLDVEVVQASNGLPLPSSLLCAATAALLLVGGQRRRNQRLGQATR
jgi:hypothetical protein